jgi:hypothetical protein
MYSWSNSLKKAALAAAAVFVFVVPTHAHAATVVNGNFETGTLAGWQTYSSTAAGNWFAYSGSKGPISEEPLLGPPSGNFAATSDEVGESNPILYQDVALEPLHTHRLGLTLYYVSQAPIFAPEPNRLSITGDNQQLRVDVVKPTAPIESLQPEDVLTTIFANKNGDPQTLLATRFSADLTPFAGQTVRLRIANAVTDDHFNSGLDDVSITSTPPPLPPSNLISRGKLALNKKRGTAKLAINVPGPGTLTAVAKGKGKAKRLRNANLTVGAAGTVKVPLNPNGVGKKVLNEKGKLKARIDVTFTPTGGTANTQTYEVTLKKNLPKVTKN